jgi:hypothetical protein
MILYRHLIFINQLIAHGKPGTGAANTKGLK